MRFRNALLVLAAVLIVSAPGTTATAGDTTATVKLSDVALDINLTLDTAGAKAIVAARVESDIVRDENGNPLWPQDPMAWPGRLIQPTPENPETIQIRIQDTATNASFIRHIEPGCLLILVNLVDEDVTFQFFADLFVERGRVFKVPADSVKVLKVKDGIHVPADANEAKFLVQSDTAFTGAPGPIMPIP